MRSTSTLLDRRGPWAFLLGVIAVTAGVLLHLPMFLMGRSMHYHLAGMPMGSDMVFGMYLVVQTNGAKLRRMNYRHLGRQKTLYFGAWPEMGIAMARQQRDKAREQIAAGLEDRDTRTQGRRRQHIQDDRRGMGRQE